MGLIALAVGHKMDAQGAVAVSGMTEYEFNKLLATQIQRRLADCNYQSIIYLRAVPWEREIRRINRDGADFVLSLHFNAAPDTWIDDDDNAATPPRKVTSTKATGTEVLYVSEKGRQCADILSSAVSAAIGIKDRGAKKQEASVSGIPLYILRDTDAVAALLESHFGDNPEDHSKARKALDNGTLADSIVKSITRIAPIVMEAK